MAHILLADDGIAFDGTTLERRPLGGAETAFVSLANALAARGHRVSVRNRCAAPVVHCEVSWAPLDAADDRETADLYIANRSWRLIGRFPRVKRRVFWIHNPASYLLKFRYLVRLARFRPPIVFSGAYHASTYPAWAPDGGRAIILYGTEERFLHAEMGDTVPGPRATFISNPLRSLDWLLDQWDRRIFDAVPGAELHIFSGPAVYGSAGDAKAERMARVLDRAKALASRGVVLRLPVAKDALRDELRRSRVLLYRGDAGETFCLAVAEAQALGVPAVLQDFGSMRERIVPDVTGFLARDDAEFAEGAIKLLRDDALWLAQHRAAHRYQRYWSWDAAAVEFEKFLQ